MKRFITIAAIVLIPFVGMYLYRLMPDNIFSDGALKNYKWEALSNHKYHTLLNDSASYDWGELGTPEVHYYFTFHDKADKCIGVTTIDLLGQAYSCPPTARMKWGYLNKMGRVKGIMKRVSNN